MLEHTDKATLEGIQIWLFDDEDASWPAVYKKDIVCEKARSKSKTCNTGQPCTKCEVDAPVSVDGKFRCTLNQQKITEGSRPRYWFVVLGKCDTGKTIPADVSYGVHFVQALRSDWNKEFGKNWMGLQTFFVLFFVLYVIFVAVHFSGVYKLRAKLEFMHPMVQLFALVVALQFVMILLSLVHYGGFVSNGKGYPGVLETSEICDAVVRVLFVLLLILLAKGWAISGNELTQKWLIIGGCITFLVIHVVIVLLEYAVKDDADTSQGAGVIFMHIVLLIGWLCFGGLFSYHIYKSYKQEDNPVKAVLYRNLALVYVPWMLAYPFTTLLVFFLPDWQRGRILVMVDVTFNTVAYFVLSFLLWPSRAEEYFCISTPDVMTAGKIDTYEQL